MHQLRYPGAWLLNRLILSLAEMLLDVVRFRNSPPDQAFHSGLRMVALESHAAGERQRPHRGDVA